MNHHDDQKEKVKLPSFKIFEGRVPSNTNWILARNPNNPLDIVGNYHNLALLELLKIQEIAGKKKTIRLNGDLEEVPSSEIYDGTMYFIENNFGSEVQTNLEQELTFPIADSSYNSCLLFLPTVQNMTESIIVENALSNLFLILTDTTDANTGDYLHLKSKIEIWENQIASNFSYTEEERSRLLVAGSIARHSMLFWISYEQENPSEFGSIIISQGRGGFLRWLGWGLVGAADAIGGFIGAGIGGPVGAIALGAGGSAAGFFIFKGRGWEPW